MLAALGLREFDELVRWASTATPSQVAALATPVLAAAKDGDAAARRITAEAASELVELVQIVEPMFSPDDALVVATAGGLLREDGPLYVAFRARLQAALPRVRLREIGVDAPLGAVRLAAEMK
jgi:N-acetylglucosamine kinase-like BadF-type ATPase